MPIKAAIRSTSPPLTPCTPSHQGRSTRESTSTTFATSHTSKQHQGSSQVLGLVELAKRNGKYSAGKERVLWGHRARRDCPSPSEGPRGDKHTCHDAAQHVPPPLLPLSSFPHTLFLFFPFSSSSQFFYPSSVSFSFSILAFILCFLFSVFYSLYSLLLLKVLQAGLQTSRKQDESKTKARRKQEGSKKEARRKQDESKAEAPFRKDQKGASLRFGKRAFIRYGKRASVRFARGLPLCSCFWV